MAEEIRGASKEKGVVQKGRSLDRERHTSLSPLPFVAAAKRQFSI